MKNNIKRTKIKGFTLVELLAVIVILAIILVIAVPKIMSVIEDTKRATLESTVKMIASSAEKAKVQNTVLGNDDEITCDSVTKINDIEYESCIIEFNNDGVAKVTIKGSGKFDNLNVCDGDRISAIADTTICNVSYGRATTYIEKLNIFYSKENYLDMKSVEYNNVMYDVGIRYVGNLNEVKNMVYFNCEDVDDKGILYGETSYDHANNCEVWRIIGVLSVDDGTGKIEKRVKLINTSSRFTASWDSSASDINNGNGINQWGESTYSDGTTYDGSDLMRLLNGFYIGKSELCKYCTGEGQTICDHTCTREGLKNYNMKVLTNTAKEMIENAVWDTNGVEWKNVRDVTWAPTAYLEEKGINKENNGKLCNENTTDSNGNYSCTDKVDRTTSWTGLVGLMSVSDATYADGWLYSQTGTYLYPWSISVNARMDSAANGWLSVGGRFDPIRVYKKNVIFPTIYLKSNIQIIDGNGTEDEPFILK